SAFRRFPSDRHGLAFDERRGTDHAAALELALAQLAPLVEPAVQGVNRSMRSHTENPALKLVLEAVHHRRDDKEYRDGEPDANHRNERNERDKTLAPAGAKIARRNRKLVRLPHGPTSSRIRARSIVIRSAARRRGRSTRLGAPGTASRGRS